MDQSDMLERVATAGGFIAALDQSGGSSPGALRAYGVEESTYDSDAQMMDLIHAMRTRIIESEPFGAPRILGAILFEDTLKRQVSGVPTADYLKNTKGVVPFLKVDAGLEDAVDSVRMMRPISRLPELMELATQHGVFGTKMRSVIGGASESGIRDVVAQQLDYAGQIWSHGFVPIVEPEVDVFSSDKAESEQILLSELTEQLSKLPDSLRIMLKLSIPSEPGLYCPLLDTPQVMRIVALSGGYPRSVANALLAQDPCMIASFSRALVEDLHVSQDDHAFAETLDENIGSIATASASTGSA